MRPSVRRSNASRSRAALTALACFLGAACAVQTNVTLGSADEASAVQTAAPRAAPPTPTPVPAPAASGVQPARAGEVVPAIEAVTLTAEECSTTGRHATIPVPSPGDVDTSYRGAVPGIEVRRILVSGSAGYRHAHLSPSGDSLEVDLWCRGGGMLLGAAGYQSCSSGSPAEARFEFVVHYRSRPPSEAAR